MRLTIIVPDNTIVKDGVALSNLDLSFIPSDIHALQWYDTYGEIEYKRYFDVETKQIIHPENTVITELPNWANQANTLT